MSRFDWDDLRHFLAVARTGRVTAAARRLGADHATVSRRITALEDALQAKLFERQPQGYVLTTEGERLLAGAENMEAQALAAASDIGGADLSPAGAVRISSSDGFGTLFLAPRLPAFVERYPQIEIQLVAMPRLLSLSKREADIAITFNRPKEGRLHARKLADYTLGLFAAPAYLASRPAIERPGDLFAHRIVGYIDDMLYTPELDYLDEIARGLKPQVQSSSVLAQLNATAAGVGVGVLHHFMVAGRQDLVPVLPDVVIRRTYWLIVHADVKDVTRVRAVVDFLVKEAKAARSLFVPGDHSGSGDIV